jgi:hypothetical protein
MSKTKVANSVLIQTLATEIQMKLGLLVGDIDTCRFQAAREVINKTLDDLLLHEIPPLEPASKQLYGAGRCRYTKSKNICRVFSAPQLLKDVSAMKSKQSFRANYTSGPQLLVDNFKTPSKQSQRVEDIVIIFANVIASLFLFVNIIDSSSISFFGSINCRETEDNGFPMERVLSTLIIISFCQSLVNNNFISIVFGWIMSILFFYQSKSNHFLSINVNYFCLCWVSYVLKRNVRFCLITPLDVRQSSETNSQSNLSETNRQISEALGIAQQQITEGKIALESKRAIVRHVAHEVYNAFFQQTHCIP